MTVSRRDRVRQATLAEIRAAARGLLIEQGPAAVTINAVAREMGMSGPALYHYFAGHDELIGAVTADFFRELTAVMEAARDACPPDDHGRRLLATCRAMRAWAITHRAEFGWVFASPITSERRPDSPRELAGRDFEQVFLEEVTELWTIRPFPVPEPGELDPSIREQLRAYTVSTGVALPVEAVHVFLTCWIRLYGLLCMEVLNQLDFAYTDLGPVFEETLRELAPKLGLDYVEA
ncbi:DNA-binding transcriptional regulator, AcrR family [Nonomuraea solani]|uniref:DNA-binding transcriptional regulator, AcrR family n=1 Tax=Nonomuraea solani TaxID=1144553 RepID=A0A1H6EVX2_9ACTN|nr:TetR/AcrR family transcriptional regulator [Nonomuraea solani]SEH01978.1 DNA-binding transcriptional regulator, AcrR family [Nonomuraea solani]